MTGWETWDNFSRLPPSPPRPPKKNHFTKPKSCEQWAGIFPPPLVRIFRPLAGLSRDILILRPLHPHRHTAILR